MPCMSFIAGLCIIYSTWKGTNSISIDHADLCSFLFYRVGCMLCHHIFCSSWSWAWHDAQLSNFSANLDGERMYEWQREWWHYCCWSSQENSLYLWWWRSWHQGGIVRRKCMWYPPLPFNTMHLILSNNIPTLGSKLADVTLPRSLIFLEQSNIQNNVMINVRFWLLIDM